MPSTMPTLSQDDLHKDGLASRSSYAARSVGLGEVCDLLKLPREMLPARKEPRFEHIMVQERQRLFTLGQPFAALYVVKTGFLKNTLRDEDGKEQVLDFPMKGDVVGVDGIYSGAHASEAWALSDTDIIVIPFPVLREIALISPGFESRMCGVLGRALNREQSNRGMIAALLAEARVARFLLMLGDRYAEMGYSNNMFNLRMTRAEIGSYLNLALETVSRVLSAFAELNLISVEQRTIVIKDREGLRLMRRLPTQFSRQRQPRRFADHE